MSFTEDRLDLGYDYGTTVSIQFKTTIVTMGSGAEQRNAGWHQPLLRFGVGQQGCLNANLQTFLQFHADRKGSFEGFRFKDWADYQAKRQYIGTGNGSTTQFQLYKSYTVAGHSVNRPIVKPVAGTVKIYLADAELTSGWSVNTVNGLITFTTAPVGVITADFEFDVPVRFQEDKISLRFLAFEGGTNEKIFNWENLSLTEIRIAPALAIDVDPLPQSLNEAINLGFDYETIGGPAFSTQIKAVSGGWEKRGQNWTEPKGVWDIGSRTLLRWELDYLIALFRVCRGRCVGFWYFDFAIAEPRRVRFNEDLLSFRFDAFEESTGESIFYLSGIAIASIKLPQFAPYVLGGGSNRQYRIYAKYLAVNGNIYLAHIGQVTGPVRSIRITSLIAGEVPQITIIQGDQSVVVRSLEYFADVDESGGVLIYYKTGSGSGSVDAFLEIYAVIKEDADSSNAPFESGLRSLAYNDRQAFPPQFWRD